MAQTSSKTTSGAGNGQGHLGFEATLWAMADKLRGNLDAAEYKHVVLGLIFLKYVSDAFEEKHAALQIEPGANPEDRDEYLAENIFWVPTEARWTYIQSLARDKRNSRFRDRRGRVLFIDGRKLGTMIDRVQRNLTPEDVQKVAGAYHAWRGDKGAAKYADVLGFTKDATLDEISAHGQVLTPGRYVGAEELDDDSEPFETKMKRLTARLEEQFGESVRLERAIRQKLKGLGYGF